MSANGDGAILNPLLRTVDADQPYFSERPTTLRDGVFAPLFLLSAGLDAVAGAAGDHGRRDDPAGESLLREEPVEPISAGAGLVDEDEVARLRAELANELIDVAVAGTDLAEEEDVAAVIGAVGDGDRFLVDIETDVQERLLGGTLCHG